MRLRVQKKQLLISLFTLLIMLILQFPAITAINSINKNNLKVNGVNGTVWKGSASEISSNEIYLRQTRWKIVPGELLKGNLTFDISTYPFNGQLKFNLILGPMNNLSATDIKGNFPNDILEIIAPFLGVSSEIDMNIKSLSLNNNKDINQLEGQILLNNLVMKGISSRVLGSYKVDLFERNGEIYGSIDDISGEVDIAATMSLTLSGKYIIDGAVSAKLNTSNQVRTILSFLGAENENGQRSFRFEGEI
tara:strand:- start:1847 stop:2593 length:747 start_codon:yes stop_codon:yes gene_type:complete